MISQGDEEHQSCKSKATFHVVIGREAGREGGKKERWKESKRLYITVRSFQALLKYLLVYLLARLTWCSMKLMSDQSPIIRWSLHDLVTLFNYCLYHLPFLGRYIDTKLQPCFVVVGSSSECYWNGIHVFHGGNRPPRCHQTYSKEVKDLLGMSEH